VSPLLAAAVVVAGLAGVGCLIAGYRAEQRQAGAVPWSWREAWLRARNQDRSIRILQGGKNDLGRRP